MQNSKFKNRRITDSNCNLYGLAQQTNFEACFYLSERKTVIFSGRIFDSSNREIFRSCDLSTLSPEAYQKWNCETDLLNFIETIESRDKISIEDPALFYTPLHELVLEVWGPTVNPKCLGVRISMGGQFIILNEYFWEGSAGISITILCERELLLDFAKGLQSDLSQILNNLDT